MFETIRDAIPYLEFRKVQSERFEAVAPQLLENYVEDIPDFIKPYAKRPEIADFDGKLYIMGSHQDMPFFMAYLQANPGAEYNIAVFTGEDVARERAIATYGTDPEELMALASLDAETSVTESLMHESEGALNELVTLKKNNVADVANRDSRQASLRTTSDVGNVIRQAIVNFDPVKVNKAPLLLGHSGISKSATIKAVISELNKGVSEKGSDWGYRLVDIRAAFFDKMDMLGMISLTSETDGSDGSLASQMNERWSDSPKLELLTCTTPFVESCRAMLTRINTGDVEVTDADEEFVNRLRDYAKTPVMFFDEINRTPKEVMNQLMVMINSHKLNDYDISIAPKLAAANLPVEMEKLDEVDEEKFEKLMYLVENVDDVAKVDRFIPYIVSSDDITIQNGAYNFLSEKDSVKKHPKLVALCDYALSERILHDISRIDINGKFPTFRGWEDTLQYLTWCLENNELPMREIIFGLLGDDTANEVSRWLEANDIEVDFDTSDTEAFTAHTYKSGLPMMLLGRMGIAKTAGINKAIADNNDEAIRIDLSSTDRVSVGGFPRAAPFLREAFGFGYKGKTSANSVDEANALKLAAVTSPLFEQFDQEVKARGDVPDQTTSFIPNKNLQDQLDLMRDGKAEGKRLVLVFDEINRCTPTVQSAVFEAISDARLFGCDLSGIDYSVVAAGNYDDSEGMDADYGEFGSTFDAAPIDTATMHRFCTKVIRELSEQDVENFKAYLEKEFPAAAYLANKMGTEVLLELLNKPYDEMADDDDEEAGRARVGGMAKPVFTMRTLPALHNMLDKDNAYVVANAAMTEAAAAVPIAQAAVAQAEAFLNLSEHPDLIYKKVDRNIGFSREALKETGLLDYLGFQSQTTITATEVYNALRDKCIGIANGEAAMTAELNDAFGSPANFMFRVHAVLEEQEDYLESTSWVQTFLALVPSYAIDEVAPYVSEYYKEQSVKAAQVALLDETDFLDESMSDDQLDQLVNRYLGQAMRSDNLEFEVMFLDMLRRVLDENPELKPSADHLSRLKEVFNANPIAMARPISANRFIRFLNEYQNKVAGAAKLLESLSNIVVSVRDMPSITEAIYTIGVVHQQHVGNPSYKPVKYLDTSREVTEYLESLIEDGKDPMSDLSQGARVATIARGQFDTAQDAYEYLTRKGIDLMQALAIMNTFMSASCDTGINGRLKAFKSEDLGGVAGVWMVSSSEGPDGHAYPDFNELKYFGHNDYTAEVTPKPFLLNMRKIGKLTLIDKGDHAEEFMKDNPSWFANLTFKGNWKGFSVTVVASDVLMAGAESIASADDTRTDRSTMMSPRGKEIGITLAMLARAKAFTNDTPCLNENFMGKENADKLPLLSKINVSDYSGNAAFLQLNYEVSMTKKGNRNADEVVQALDILGRPDSAIEFGSQDENGLTAGEAATLMLAAQRVDLDRDVDEINDDLVRYDKVFAGYLPDSGNVTLNRLIAGASERVLRAKRSTYTMTPHLRRMAATFRGVWN